MSDWQSQNKATAHAQSHTKLFISQERITNILSALMVLHCVQHYLWKNNE